MCGFCAVFAGVPHWTETASNAGDSEQSTAGYDWRLARQRRVLLINRVLAHYGCRVDDWMGGQYIVASQRGHTELVPHLPQVWQVVERIAGRPVDPLAPELLAALLAAAPSDTA